MADDQFNALVDEISAQLTDSSPVAPVQQQPAQGTPQTPIYQGHHQYRAPDSESALALDRLINATHQFDALKVALNSEQSVVSCPVIKMTSDISKHSLQTRRRKHARKCNYTPFVQLTLYSLQR